MASDFKQGTCAWCGDDTEVYRDNDHCERCDSDTIYCHVCRCREHYENKCRHVFQDQHLQWSGAGTGMMPERNVRRSFLDPLDAMPNGFVTDLRKAIRSGKFFTWIIAPIIGGGGILELNGMDYAVGTKYGDAILQLGEGCTDGDGLADGYRWLASLYKRSTKFGNNITLRWIAEWMDRRDLLRLADDGCLVNAAADREMVA